MKIVAGNLEQDLDALTLAKLGRYVYALRDPRDRKVFYIGKAGGADGHGNERVFHHFDEARRALESPQASYSAKVRRIVEIWAAGESVEWFIVRHGLEPVDDAAVLHVEAALIDMLEISQNGPALNAQRGHYAADHGLLSSNDVRALAVPPVMPVDECWLNRPVFIFPVHNAIDGGLDAFSATCGDWSVSEAFRRQPDALAVGVARGLSVGAFDITGWQQVGKLWRFQGTSLDESDLHLRSYLGVISRAIGYWMRGNFLVVEFLPGRAFRFLRGSSVRDELPL